MSTQSVPCLPAFHAKAKQDAEARSEIARGERDRASEFLDEIDRILQSDD